MYFNSQLQTVGKQLCRQPSALRTQPYRRGNAEEDVKMLVRYSCPAGPGFTVKRPIIIYISIKDLYAFSGRCTKFRYSCSARQNTFEFFLHEYVKCAPKS